MGLNTFHWILAGTVWASYQCPYFEDIQSDALDVHVKRPFSNVGLCFQCLCLSVDFSATWLLDLPKVSRAFLLQGPVEESHCSISSRIIGCFNPDSVLNHEGGRLIGCIDQRILQVEKLILPLGRQNVNHTITCWVCITWCGCILCKPKLGRGLEVQVSLRLPWSK